MSQPITEGAELVRVAFHVRPLPGHPLYWSLQYALLQLWIYANSRDGAIATAEEILAALPYERVSDDVDVFEVPATYVDDSRARSLSLRAQLAKESGLSLMLIGVGVGDEGDAADTFPLVA